MNGPNIDTHQLSRTVLEKRSTSRSVWIAADRAAGMGSGSEEDPLSTPSAEIFDDLIHQLPAKWTLRLHAGTYFTKGNCSAVPPGGKGSYWRLRSGQRWLGAGMPRTTLRMVPNEEKARHPHQRWCVLGTDDYAHLLDGVEISDLTLDVNMSEMPDTIVGGGLFVLGNNHLFDRVRMINWGSGVRTPTECFCAAAGGGHPNLGSDSVGSGNRFVDCVAENPIADQGDSGATGFICGMSGESRSSGEQLFGRDNHIMGCLVRGVDPSKLVRAFTAGGENVSVVGCRAESVKAGFYVDTWSSVSTRIADNVFDHVGCGIQMQMGDSLLRSGGIAPAEAKIRDGHLHLATREPNNLSLGEWISFRAVGDSTRYYARVTAAGKDDITAKLLDSAPEPLPAITWGRVWNRGRVDVLDNTIRLTPTNGRIFHGITMQGNRLPTEISAFKNVTVNANRIGYDRQSDRNFAAIIVTRAEVIEVRDNVVPPPGQIITDGRSVWKSGNRIEG